MRLLHAVAALLIGSTPAVAGCAGDPAPCTVAGGTYQIELPPAAPAAPGLPAVEFLHGWGASGDAMMANRPMVEALLARGYAVIAPDGLARDGGPGRTWDFLPGRPARRNEAAFLMAVADDAAARFGLDRGRMLLAGFSIGGSMTSYVACSTPGAFAAYAPVAGSFWDPLPASCAGPVRLLHTHGWTDSTVPLEGRRIGEAGLTQGDVFASMAIWRQTNGCSARRPDAFGRAGEIAWRRWTDCTPGSGLEFALHPGNHLVPEGWADLALDWFEAPAP